MDEKPEPAANPAEDNEQEMNSPWAVIGVMVVVLMALCSAIYFVEIRQEELKAANAVSELEPAQQGETTIRSSAEKN
jgi:hypothetical protein